jgi:hypothetical protein
VAFELARASRFVSWAIRYGVTNRRAVLFSRGHSTGYGGNPLTF